MSQPAHGGPALLLLQARRQQLPQPSHRLHFSSGLNRKAATYHRAGRAWGTHWATFALEQERTDAIFLACFALILSF